MRIALVASEAHPFSKTGGLADVTGALFREYAAMGHESVLFVPLYNSTRAQFSGTLVDTGIATDVPLGEEMRRCTVLTLTEGVDAGGPSSPGLGSGGLRGRVYFVAEDDFFGRNELYGTSREEFSDNDRRFAFFSRAVLEFCRQTSLEFDIIHANDWHTGLIPLYLTSLYRGEPVFRKTKSVFTIHNMAYQGIFPRESLPVTGLGPGFYSPEGIEYYGGINFLKAGILGADSITTVSGTYAREILTPQFGAGLDGFLRKRAGKLHGIVNGIDYADWDPATDRLLPERYGPEDLSGKRACKRELIRRTGLKATLATPLLAFVGRLSRQKGIELIAEAVPGLAECGARFIIVGKGDEGLQALMSSVREQFPGLSHVTIGFDEPLARLTYAGADIFLMPSQYEPCGLGQMIAMRYGTIPVGRRTGGLSDTIADCGPEPERLYCERLFGELTATGFLFDDFAAGPFSYEVRRALCCYAHRDIWRKVMRNAMMKDFSWARSAQQYVDLYTGLIAA